MQDTDQMEVVKERKRAILDAMPETLYRSLPSADLTAELCSSMIARAVRARNPRLVRQWVNYERTRAMDADLRASFELALDVEMAATSNLRDTDMGAMIRAEVRACFDEASAPATVTAASSFVEGLLVAIGTFDQALRQHSINVSRLAGRLATAAKFADDRVTHIVQAALVHELGRLRMDRQTLNLAVRFDAEKRQLVRKQLADVSALDELPATQELGQTVYGLYLADPLTASDEVRLLRVVDAFESLCEARPCRPALSPHETLDRLWTQRGLRFDPGYVALLAEVLGYQHRYARTA
jgi:HD-GYP domain-containing protein (c-di-GMP phosphodiesterase class II)